MRRSLKGRITLKFCDRAQLFSPFESKIAALSTLPLPMRLKREGQIEGHMVLINVRLNVRSIDVCCTEKLAGSPNRLPWALFVTLPRHVGC